MAINPYVPTSLRSRLTWLPDRARSMGTHLMAGKGSGKSRLMGRVIAWLDFLRGTPVVILDPVGPTIDNVLDKLIRLPREEQQRLWSRVIYVDMSGQGSNVVGWPLYYRLGNESLYAISQRYLDVIRRIDPALQSASVEGWNSLHRIGTHTGMAMTALGCQVTEAEHFLTNLPAWRERLLQAYDTHPDLEATVLFFLDEFAGWKEERQLSRTDAFRSKITLFRLDPTMRAMFGAAQAGIDWAQVVEERKMVLLDFRHEHDVERRRFKMLWAYMSFMEFVKHRGAGRHRPVSFIVDELAALGNFRSSNGASLFADDLEELINVFARNCAIWLTLAHQEIYQFEERIQKTLMTMGTHIFGVTSDTDAALQFARLLYRYDPFKIKRMEPMYMTFEGEPMVIDERVVEYTIEEQNLLNSYKFRSLPAFHFLVRAAPGEGDTTGQMRHMSIANFDRGMWVQDELVAQARHQLRERTGQSKNTVLDDVRSRVPSVSDGVMSTIRTYGTRHYLPVPENDDEATLREEKAPTAEARDRQ